MTFHPSRYEHSYGFHLLDDIHNLFPELLYDTGLFPVNPLLTFLQMRTNELFPEEYSRNRSHYRLYQLQQRREAIAIPAMQNTRPLSTRLRSRTSESLQTVRTTEPQTPRTVQAFTIPLTGDTLTNLFTTLLGQDITDLLTPVPIVPTAAELGAASILSSVEPAADIVCAICQDHEQPTDSTEWRILRHCDHRFHRSCIDTWFQQNVHCPVCRHDIRD